MLKGVEVVGMREFTRKLRAANPVLANELKVGLKEVAQLVADTAQPTVPQRSGNLRRSLRPFSSVKTAEVKMGGAKVPYAGFIEYGGAVGRNRSVRRTFISQGRYLRPAYERRQANVEFAAERVLDRVIRRLD